MINAPTDLLEDGTGAGDRRGIAASHTQKLTVSRRFHRAAHWAFHQRGSLGTHALSKAARGFGRDRAHIYEELALDISGQQACGPS